MERPIDFQRLASRMRTVQSRFPQVCKKAFIAELKGILNPSEAERLFQYFCETQKLVPSQRKFHFHWTVHQDFFEPDAMRTIVKHNLIGSYELRSLQQKKSWENRREPKLAEIGAQMVENAIKALSSFSDEELQAELNRRAKVREQKERLSAILAVAEISLDELKSLIRLAE